MRDTTGDGVADTRVPLLTGFGYVDTHGNQNGFTRGLDGWIYANHGFRNNSAVKLPRSATPDRVVMRLNSGNTYRFKPDGSAAEHLTHGQVNPFGVCFDEWGYRYTADCHSMPVYQMIDGAHYPSFGKPDDGLGFAPKMIDHNHGSTGIGGIAFYHAGHFPAEYRGNLFLGNVVTGRVHRDVIEWRGSTPHARKQPDFVTCDDPWFHPVDIQLGPDGALYIADFYGPIIGHYEVPLDHPKRDRFRGRIWRVVYVGEDGKAEPPKMMADLTKLDFEKLFELSELTDNEAARALVTHEFVRRFPKEAKAEAFGTYISWSGAKRENAKLLPAQAHALWHDFRVSGSADVAQIQSPEPMVLTAAMRVLAAKQTLNWAELSWIRERLHWDYEELPECAHVRRAAVEALARHPHLDNVKPLLDLWLRTPSEDTHLIHATRVALREQLRDTQVMAAVADMKFSDDRHKRLFEIALAVPTDAAALYVFRYALTHDVGRDVLLDALPRVARNIPEEDLHAVSAMIQERFANDPGTQLDLFLALEKGMQERGLSPDETMLKWVSRVVTRVLLDAQDGGRWTHLPHPDAPSKKDPWAYQKRKCEDGKTVDVMSSFPHGEQLTGVLRSPVFVLPKSLSFYLCGHNGHPGQPDHGKNRVRLRLVDGDAVIAEQAPPRNDTAKKYTWDLSAHEGKRGYFEAVDGDTAKAYAWLAFGRIEPAVVPMPRGGDAERDKRVIAAIELAGRSGRTDADRAICDLITDERQPTAIRVAAIENLTSAFIPFDALWEIFDDADAPMTLRTVAARRLGRDETPDRVILAMGRAPQEFQAAIASGLVSTSQRTNVLLNAIETGIASPRLLTDTRLVERMRAMNVTDLDKRVAELTKGLIPADERAKQLIAQRRDAYGKAPRDAARGRVVFQRICAACHQIKGVGNRVGPSLDGIGVRGLDRLLEDVIDPSRNVDGAFRMTIVTTKTSTLVGLGVREEGKVLVLVDTAGTEHRVPLDDIKDKRVANMSLMPPGLVDTMPESEFHDLMAYLLSQTSE